MEKRKFVFVLCIIALLFTAKSNVYAAAYYGDFQYQEDEKSVSIYAYNGAEAEVTIPAYIKRKPVTEIKDYAFLLCNSVEKIIVPSTVKRIAADAFSGAANLKEVVLASEDTKVEEKDEPNKPVDNQTGSKEDQSGSKEDQSGSNKDQKQENGSTVSEADKPAYSVTVDPTVDTKNAYDIPLNAETDAFAETGSDHQNKETLNYGGEAASNASDISNQQNEIVGIDEGFDEEEAADSDTNANANEITQTEEGFDEEKNTNSKNNTFSNTETDEKRQKEDSNESSRTASRHLWVIVSVVVLVLAIAGGVFLWKKKKSC